MRVSPWNLAPLETGERSATFQDENGREFTLRFGGVDGLSLLRPYTLARQWAEQFGQNGEFPLRLPSPDGEVIEVDEPTASQVAQLCARQISSNGDAPYELIEWLGFAKRRPDVWVACLRMIAELEVEDQQRLGGGMTPQPTSTEPSSPVS